VVPVKGVWAEGRRDGNEPVGDAVDSRRERRIGIELPARIGLLHFAEVRLRCALLDGGRRNQHCLLPFYIDSARSRRFDGAAR